MTRTDLYRQLTADQESHHRKIDGHYKRLPKRTREIIDARAAGKTLDEIGAKHGITRGSVSGTITRAMASIRNKIIEAPRYWKTGRLTAAEQQQRARNGSQPPATEYLAARGLAGSPLSADTTMATAIRNGCATVIANTTTCIDCGAQKGEPCRDGNGYFHRDTPEKLTEPRPIPHATRRDAWKEATAKPAKKKRSA